MRQADYDLTYYTIQHRYREQETTSSLGRGWVFSNYDSIAAPAKKAGHEWLGSTGGPSVTGALTLEDGLRGLVAVRKYHEECPASPNAHEPYHGDNNGIRTHKSCEFRLVKIHLIRHVTEVIEERLRDVVGL